MARRNSRWFLVYSSVLAASWSCSSSGLGGTPSPPVLADLAKAPGASLVAERTITRPPVKPGEARLAPFDVDLLLPAGANVHESPTEAFISWSSCAVEITPTAISRLPRVEHTPRVVRRVGTLELACAAAPSARNAMDPPVPSDARCLEICDHMTPVAGSTAEDRYPTDPPVIEFGLSGGVAYRSLGALVWRDGTVQFYGSACTTWRGRRASLPPARVAAVLAAVERGGFFHYHRNDESNCNDAIHGAITARSGSLHNSLDVNQCDRKGLWMFAQSLGQAIGDNPCQPF